MCSQIEKIKMMLFVWVYLNNGEIIKGMFKWLCLMAIQVYQQIQQLLIISKMNCKSCLVPYSNIKPNLPRVLVTCGHTLCQSCIEKSFPLKQLACPECAQFSYGGNFHQYPLNATLISLMKEQQTCKVHNLKLQAYCEKDNQLLCLNCVIGGQHKSHKISSVSQKVSKDRGILKECMKQIQQSNKDIKSVVNSIEQSLQKLDHQYKDYLLQIGLCFSNIRETIKQVEDKWLCKAKAEYQGIKEKYKVIYTDMNEKKLFLVQLAKIYEEVVNLPNLQYLQQDNKRLFIMDNCKVKKPRVQYMKLVFNRVNALTEMSNMLNQMIGYEKKLQNQSFPILKSKKSTRGKEPTVLEVNLNQQYKKHYKNVSEAYSTSFINFTPANSNVQRPKSKFEKEKQRERQKNHSNNDITKTPKQQKSMKKQSIPATVVIRTSKQLTNHNKSFQSQCLDCLGPELINSFMESSNTSFTLRGSEADYTMMGFETKIFHFGGHGNTSIQYSNIDDQGNSVILTSANFDRSKAQCVIIPSYNKRKCLIFGGKSAGEKKLDTFIEFDLDCNKWSNSLFKLSQAKSGFGCALKDNNVYVAGGSSSEKSLKTFQQYRINSNSIAKRQLPQMNHCRDELGFTLGLDGYFYACGGFNQSGSVLSSCQRFNPNKCRWQIISSMNKPRRSFTLASLPHGIYAVGGYDGNQYLRQVQLYDFSLQKWIVIASMNEPRFAHTSIVTTDLQNIIVAGGFYKKPLKSVEVLDIINEKWMPGPSLQTERFLHCSVVANI